MGASQSKQHQQQQKAEPVVFYNDLSAFGMPIKLTPTLVQKLDKPSSVAAPTTATSQTPAPSSTPTPATQKQQQVDIEPEITRRVKEIIRTQIEPKVEGEVQRRLNEALAARAEKSKYQEDKTRYVDEGKEKFDSSIAIREVDDVLRRAGKERLPPTTTHLAPSPIAVESQKELMNCLTKNKSRPLDCYREVEKFKQSLKTVQKVRNLFSELLFSYGPSA
ncbi:hypothetical protein BKA69DRAFT_1154835, partial [Paraphysoderma sedebokerense]